MDRMLVSIHDLKEVAEDLSSADAVFLDSETTGLSAHNGDRIFSLILGTRDKTYYFNFMDYPDIGDEFILDKPEVFSELQSVFLDQRKTFVIHNAKFDLTMLHAEGVEIVGKIHCTMIMERLIDSETQPGKFNLQAVSEKYGSYKDDKVKLYIVKNKLWTERYLPGSMKKVKDFHFTQVPFELMYDYACQDVDTLRVIYGKQLEAFRFMSESTPAPLPGPLGVYLEEMELIKTVMRMETRGVLCDRAYCRRAMADAKDRMQYAKDEYKKLTGLDFIDSGKEFKTVFSGDKSRWVYGDETATGKVNPSFDSDVLKTFEHPAAKLVLMHRDALSDYNFYAGFIDAMDPRDYIHTNLNQHGAGTGRFSSSNPNLQNMTKDEGEDLKAEFVIRRAIIPRPGHVFHMIDYKTMEYIVMLDYAARFSSHDQGVRKLIELVKQGFDVHQATADIVRVTRPQAKTVNFALLYGSGDNTLAKNLRTDKKEATRLRNAVFSASPEIETLIDRTAQAARTRGYVVTWKGRRLRISDTRFSYKAINYLIQGGSADIVKTAMNRVEGYLSSYKTKLVLMIHDELILDGPPEEAPTVVPAVMKIMSEAFQGKHLSLSVDVEHSFKSLGDKVKGVANAQN